MGKPLSPSERRGLLWVAGAALLVILAGILTSRCDSSSSDLKSPDQELIVRPETDSLTHSSETKRNREREKDLKKRAGRKSSGKASPKEYRRRDPRHEPVDSILP